MMFTAILNGGESVDVLQNIRIHQTYHPWRESEASMTSLSPRDRVMASFEGEQEWFFGEILEEGNGSGNAPTTFSSRIRRW